MTLVLLDAQFAGESDFHLENFTKLPIFLRYLGICNVLHMAYLGHPYL